MAYGLCCNGIPVGEKKDGSYFRPARPHNMHRVFSSSLPPRLYEIVPATSRENKDIDDGLAMEEDGVTS